MLRAVYESFCRALIRFFDSRSVQSDEVQYLRNQIEALRLENFKLTKFILEPKTESVAADDDNVEWKPARELKTWEQKRTELERASLKRAQELKREAAQEIERSKSTQQLEQELLG